MFVFVGKVVVSYVVCATLENAWKKGVIKVAERKAQKVESKQGE